MRTGSPIVRAAKKLAAAVAPRLYRQISFYRNEGRLLRIRKKLVAHCGPFVLGGPFRGMRYVETSVGSVLNPKLVGSYEEELHPLLEKVVASDYETIVDIGCAEGYYAVGLLLRMRRARCAAFDLDSRARELCAEMARLNKVADRLAVRGRCSPEQLQPAISGRTFILCDCEGAELELLNPLATPQLNLCDLLVELHEFLRPGLTPLLRERFAATHEIEIINQTDRDGERYPDIRFLPKLDRHMAVQEFRPARMQWAMFTALRDK